MEITFGFVAYRPPDSTWSRAKEDTLIHCWAHNQSNGVTKSEARDLVRRVAHVLRHRFGIGKHGAGKDVVLCVASLSPFYPIILYAIIAAGGVYSGASTAFTANELARQIQDSEAKLLICSEEYEPHMKEAARKCRIASDRILVMDSETPNSWQLYNRSEPHCLDSPDGRSRMLEWTRLTSLHDLQNTTTCLLYSSGTTGLPKGVRLSHWNLVAGNIISMQVSSHLLTRDPNFQYRTLAHLPMAHIAGIMMYAMNPVYMGGTAYWMRNYKFEEFVGYAEQYGITVQFSVPPIWLQVSKAPRSGLFEGLGVAIAGAAPMGVELAREVSGKIGKGLFMTQTWGTTETTGSITATGWDVRDETGSVGGILPNTKLRIVDDDGVDVPAGEVGELLVKGPGVMQGYHHNETATREAIRDGWYATGDIGKVKDGLVYIVDRKKELIKYKGLQVAPAELEDCLVGHEKIKDAAVIGVFSKELGTEVPKAFVVRADEGFSEQDVMEFVKRNLAGHKQLRGGVEFIDVIPKSPSGKILRKELRQRPSGETKAKL
ncbi:4-coumarate- ligase [Lecanosticta acicola]|uniref:4-coumarate- ligase n=1 Tax=Lecanosticta acicola TaxID=111012 RepID=A0AAI8YUC8_9PEZI|nr:4-coumarate- ligase [Lecanosticta acicola]